MNKTLIEQIENFIEYRGDILSEQNLLEANLLLSQVTVMLACPTCKGTKRYKHTIAGCLYDDVCPDCGGSGEAVDYKNYYEKKIAALQTTLRNALLSFKIMKMPKLDDNVAGNAAMLAVVEKSFEDALNAGEERQNE